MVTAITLFAGAGGWDSGFQACGVPVLAALNHNERSLATHKLNFPGTRQVLTDITADDPAAFPHATILEASPECRYHSHSRGKKLLEQDQMPLWEGGWTDGEHDDPATHSRVTMNEVVRWTRTKKEQGHPFELVYVENVPEVRLWSGYQAWIREMKKLDYHVQEISFNSMFAPDLPAPCHESRDRWYAVFSRKGNPMPDLDIRPPAYCQHCQQRVGARQSWKNGKKWGDYGRQYVYACPCCDKEVVPLYHPARDIINWTIPTPAIGSRSLAESTYQNIKRGLARYNQHSAFLMSYYGNATFRSVDSPIGTVTTKDRHALITVPHPDTTVEECGYRMLTIEEYKRAMGYPPSFRFACSKTETLRQIGLSVTPATAAMLIQRGLASLGYPLETGAESGSAS